MRFVELEEARAARGLRLVVVSVVPSPWSQGALGLLDLKGLDYVAVRFRRKDEALERWTGANNAPVAFFDDEPPRRGWAEILELAQRLGGRVSLVPDDEEGRTKLFGLAHDLLGENGLAWSVRLLLTHASFESGGREGWPTPLAAYLAPKYGYAPERADAARARALAVLARLGRLLAASREAGHEYLLGPTVTALDVYAATTLATIVPMADEQCPLPAPIRQAFETLDRQVRDAVPASLLEHREQMFRRHLVLPVRM
jgi:glutathione S-transferase